MVGFLVNTAGGVFAIGAYAYFFWSLPLAATAFLLNLRYAYIYQYITCYIL